MAEPGRTPPRQSALGALLTPRRLGPSADPPAVRLRERSARVLWQIAAWRAGDVAPLRATIAEHLGVDLPEGPDAASGERGLVALHVAPQRWWLVAPAAAQLLDAALADALAGRVALTDLSHARTLLRLSGPASRSVLAKLCRIDLHPRALPPGRIAQTPLAQVAALIHLVDDAPSFDLYLPRSLAHSATLSLLEAVSDLSLEFGA